MFSMATALRPQVKLFRDTINTKDKVKFQKKGMVRANSERFQTKHGDQGVFLVSRRPSSAYAHAFGRTYRSSSLRVTARVVCRLPAMRDGVDFACPSSGERCVQYPSSIHCRQINPDMVNGDFKMIATPSRLSH